MRLSDTIEQFIKELLTDETNEVEVKRNELASYFGCAPSQINYVLSTRFTQDNGYLIESHRGGGGCIRIVRVAADDRLNLFQLILKRIGGSIGETEAMRLIEQLRERGMITDHDTKMMLSAVSNRTIGLPLPEEMKDILRARLLRSMICVVMRDLQIAEGGTDYGL